MQSQSNLNFVPILKSHNNVYFEVDIQTFLMSFRSLEFLLFSLFKELKRQNIVYEKKLNVTTEDSLQELVNEL